MLTHCLPTDCLNFRLFSLYRTQDVELEVPLQKEKPGKTTASKQRVHVDYVFSKTFDTNADAIAAVKNEKIWSYYYRNDTKDGVRVTYRCNKVKFKGKQCGASIYLFYDSESSSVHLHRSNSEHTHDEHPNIPEQISQEVQDDIKSMYLIMKMKPKAIRFHLTKKGMKVPTTNQLASFLSKLRKEKYGEEKKHFGELEKWLIENSTVPSDESEPFIVQHEISYDNVKNPQFRFFASTIKLLEMAVEARKIHADATYKLVWQGFPVLVVGTTDMGRQFHPFGMAVCSNETSKDFEFIFGALKEGVKNIFKADMKPQVLICDAANSISNGYKEVFEDDHMVVMCWAHARKNIVKKASAFLKNKQQLIEFIYDLDKLQLSKTTRIFNKASNLFLLKWKSISSELVEYFEREWLLQNRYWYEGARLNTPSTNNGLESFNATIKREHTFRERLELSRFLVVLFEMLKQLSEEYTHGLKIFENTPKIELLTWTSAYHWARSNMDCVTQVTENMIEYIIPARHTLSSEQLDISIEKEKKVNWLSFDEFKIQSFHFSTTRFPYPLNKTNWQQGICDCYDYLKYFICSHILGIALRMKFTTAPIEAKNIPIGEKRKRGRPEKAKNALTKQ